VSLASTFGSAAVNREASIRWQPVGTTGYLPDRLGSGHDSDTGSQGLGNYLGTHRALVANLEQEKLGCSDERAGLLAHRSSVNAYVGTDARLDGGKDTPIVGERLEINADQLCCVGFQRRRVAKGKWPLLVDPFIIHFGEENSDDGPGILMGTLGLT
jgi:hypothetical protein